MKEGKITKDTVVTATAADQSMSKIYEISNNNIVAGVDYTVSELITMTAVPSSNVATIMLANLLSNHDADAFYSADERKVQGVGDDQYHLEQSEWSGHFNLPRFVYQL